jgi:hypothetical protein
MLRSPQTASRAERPATRTHNARSGVILRAVQQGVSETARRPCPSPREDAPGRNEGVFDASVLLRGGSAKGVANQLRNKRVTRDRVFANSATATHCSHQTRLNLSAYYATMPPADIQGAPSPQLGV